MAFRDENGRITIDDVAAAVDINCIRRAIVHLENAKKLLEQMRGIAEPFSGNTASGVTESAVSLQQQVAVMGEAAERTAAYITKTVRKYEQIDANIKASIDSYIG